MTEPMRLSKIFLRGGAIQGGGGPKEAKEASLSDEEGGGGEGRGGAGRGVCISALRWTEFHKIAKTQCEKFNGFQI